MKPSTHCNNGDTEKKFKYLLQYNTIQYNNSTLK